MVWGPCRWDLFNSLYFTCSTTLNFWNVSVQALWTSVCNSNFCGSQYICIYFSASWVNVVVFLRGGCVKLQHLSTLFWLIDIVGSGKEAQKYLIPQFCMGYKELYAESDHCSILLVHYCLFSTLLAPVLEEVCSEGQYLGITSRKSAFASRAILRASYGQLPGLCGYTMLDDVCILCTVSSNGSWLRTIVSPTKHTPCKKKKRGSIFA